MTQHSIFPLYSYKQLILLSAKIHYFMTKVTKWSQNGVPMLLHVATGKDHGFKVIDTGAFISLLSYLCSKFYPQLYVTSPPRGLREAFSGPLDRFSAMMTQSYSDRFVSGSKSISGIWLLLYSRHPDSNTEQSYRK